MHRDVERRCNRRPGRALLQGKSRRQRRQASPIDADMTDPGIGDVLDGGNRSCWRRLNPFYLRLCCTGLLCCAPACEATVDWDAAPADLFQSQARAVAAS
jgi:hypothetical protein